MASFLVSFSDELTLAASWDVVLRLKMSLGCALFGQYIVQYLSLLILLYQWGVNLFIPTRKPYFCTRRTRTVWVWIRTLGSDIRVLSLECVLQSWIRASEGVFHSTTSGPFIRSSLPTDNWGVDSYLKTPSLLSCLLVHLKAICHFFSAIGTWIRASGCLAKFSVRHSRLGMCLIPPVVVLQYF
jgi:hypothetical protein